MNKINWTQVVVFGIVVVIAFLVAISLLTPWGGWGYSGMMGGGMMGPGMMGGFGFGLGPLGWIFMLVGWLIPLGFLALVVLGVVWLARAVSGQPARALPQPPAPTASCPQCHRGLQADWKACPYCGHRLT